ncbi:hypothetical protein HQS1_42690 [Delftia lacustris]|nr:hypothetical protein HQS1_42690 [Delftia lacustris]
MKYLDTRKMETTIQIQFEGNQADDGRINLYDAAEALKGLATSINIITQAFSNDDHIQTKVPIQKEFKTFFSAAKKGCFDIFIDVKFEQKTIQKHGASVVKDKYWDYLTEAFAASTGNSENNTSHYLRKFLDENPGLFDEMAIAIDSHVLNIHRPICNGSAKSAKLIRPYSGEKLELNKKTHIYLSTLTKERKITHLTGNVTRHSNISGFGRAYIKEYNRIIPYYIVDHKKKGKAVDTLAAESLRDGSALGIGKGGLCSFEVNLVRDNKEYIKKFELINITPILPDTNNNE